MYIHIYIQDVPKVAKRFITYKNNFTKKIIILIHIFVFVSSVAQNREGENNITIFSRNKHFSSQIKFPLKIILIWFIVYIIFIRVCE